ncbi:MAG TPA: archaetidylserine decarboxylase [Steroidobacteraceae bacterium]|nr:archaetidylserine decarboxylase [Steroidobacteraceae bacterium]
MTLRSILVQLAQQEDVNFLLTNRIPRRTLTRLVGWLSRIENPLVVRTALALWRLFSDLDLSEARTRHFRTLHECFTRQLQEGARPIDPDPRVVVSPCDGVVGACGHIESGMVLQAKGLPYALAELLGDERLVPPLAAGSYLTLRLTSSMYHRFHAPYDLRVERVTYISGDTWNVNPIALQRIARLFCRNERAVLHCRLEPSGMPLLMVPVAAILVASIRLHFLDVTLHLKYRGPNLIPCDARLRKGEELGWFEHGSTILVFAPPGLRLARALESGKIVRMGQPLLELT